MATNMNNNKIAANAIKENGSIGKISSHEEIYHMNWDTLQIFQPGKISILNHWWEAMGKYPQKNSTPVFDLTTQKCYPTLGLIYDSYTADYTKTYIAVKKSINEGEPVRMATPISGSFPIFDGHVFMAVEDVPIKILETALKNYEKNQKRINIKEQEVKKEMEKIRESLSKIENLIK